MSSKDIIAAYTNIETTHHCAQSFKKRILYQPVLYTTTATAATQPQTQTTPLTHSALQRLSAHGRHQRGDGACVKAGETEPQAAVHTVGGELEGLLTNVELLLEHRVGLLLVQVLHHSVFKNNA